MPPPPELHAVLRTDRSPARAALAVAGIGLAAVPLTWWGIGDLSVPDVPARYLDFAVGPFAVDPRLEYAIGWLAAAVAMVGLVVLLDEVLRRRAGTRWLLVATLSTVAAACAAGGWRVETAGVIGADIGAGGVMLLGPPAVSLLIAGAVLIGGAPRRERRRRP